MDLTALEEAQAEAQEAIDAIKGLAAQHEIEIERMQQFKADLEEDILLYRSALAEAGVEPDDVIKPKQGDSECES